MFVSPLVLKQHEKNRLVLDTNVLVSALGWQGNPGRILEFIAGKNNFLNLK